MGWRISKKLDKGVTMNSSTIAILLSASLPFAKRLMGSKSSSVNWNPLGFSWYPKIPLYHATVGYSKIKDSGRLKLRSQLIAQGQTNTAGAGGGEKGFVSTTIEKDRALAIAVGTNVLRKLAQGEINYLDLYETFRNIEPLFYNSYTPSRYFLMGMKQKHVLDQEYEKYLSTYNFTEENYTRKEFNFDQGVKIYRAFLLAYKDAYDPIFFAPTWKNYLNIKESDIGLLVGGSSIDRISLTGRGAERLGFVPEGNEYIWFKREVLDSFDSKIKHCLRDAYDIETLKASGQSLDSFMAKKDVPTYAWEEDFWYTRDFPRRTEELYNNYIDGIKINWINKLLIAKSDVMTFHLGENEVEIWDPTKFHVDWEKSKNIRELGLQDKLFIPNTEEMFCAKIY